MTSPNGSNLLWISPTEIVAGNPPRNILNTSFVEDSAILSKLKCSKDVLSTSLVSNDDILEKWTSQRYRLGCFGYRYSTNTKEKLLSDTETESVGKD